MTERRMSGGELLVWLRQQHGHLRKPQLADLVDESRSMIAETRTGHTPAIEQFVSRNWPGAPAKSR